MGRVSYIEALIFVAFDIPARLFSAAIDTYSPNLGLEIPRQIYWQLSSLDTLFGSKETNTNSSLNFTTDT